MPVQKTCVVCGTKFSVPPARALTASACSHKCAVQVRAKSRERKASLVCANCGKTFLVPRSHRGRRVYCSEECRQGSSQYRAKLSESGRGEKNSNWNGGFAYHSDGYILKLEPQHPRAVNGYVFVHRLVMEEWLREEKPDSPFLEKLGDNLYLRKDAHVHHIDEDVTNNSRDNLLVCGNPAHMRLHRGKITSEDAYWPEVANN